MQTSLLAFAKTTSVMVRYSLFTLLRHYFGQIAFILLLGLTGVVTDLLPPVMALEERVGLAWLFHWRGAVPAPAQVVVIAIDQASTRALGLPPKPDQWPRALHARLVRQLAQAGAAVIAFDLLFDKASTSVQQDDALAAAMREANTVVLTESLVQDQITISDANGRQVAAASIEKTTLPITVLSEAALGTAPFPLPKNTRVDAAWFFKSSAGSIPMLPTLVLQLYAIDMYDRLHHLLQKEDADFAASLPANHEALLHTGAVDKLAMQLRHYVYSHPVQSLHLLRAINTNVDINHQRQSVLRALLGMYRGGEARYLNFYGPPRSITTIPYHLALQNQGVGSDIFRGKAIFIGYSAASISGQDRLRDDYDTVYSQEDGLHLSGVEIGATAFANALEERFIQPLDTFYRIGVLFAWGCLLALLCRACRLSRATLLLLLLTALYLWAALYLFIRHQLWLPMITPLLIQLPLALFGTTLLRYLATK